MFDKEDELAGQQQPVESGLISLFKWGIRGLVAPATASAHQHPDFAETRPAVCPSMARIMSDDDFRWGN